MENQKQIMSVMPTSRDYFVLKGLYDFKVMSFPQISRMYFEGNAKPTVVNRLSKLEGSGLISKYKVPRLLTSGSENVISVVYQITRSGIRVLQKWQPEFDFWPEPLSLQPFSVDHDLLLVDVLETLKKQKPGLQILLGDHFSRTPNVQGLKPDGLLIMDEVSKPVALELELTAKSEKRYRELILKYRLTKDFDHVLYVTGHVQIAAKMRSIIGVGDVTGRFKFCQVSDILKPNEGQNNFNLQLFEVERKAR
jgi:DNA-binding Lrp family transcriptional regulator